MTLNGNGTIVGNAMTKEEFLQAYILARAGAITGNVTSRKLVESADNVWQEMQYVLGTAERPAEPFAAIEPPTGGNVIGFDRQTGEIFDAIEVDAEPGQ